MRLTVLNRFYVPDLSPTAHLAASLAEHRARRGDTVTVVAGRGGYVEGASPALPYTGGNPRVHRLWTPRLGKATLLRRVIDYLAFLFSASLRLLRLPRQDVIVSMTTPPYIVLAALLHRLRHRSARVVLWTMDMYPEAAERLGALRPGSLLARLLRAVSAAVFARVDRVVCLDQAMRELLLAHYALDGLEKRCAVIPNWESHALFPPLETPAAEAERSAPLVVLYLGNAGAGHEFATVLAVAEALRDEPVAFRFVGGGSRYPWLEREKRQRGLDNVVLAPYVSKEQTPPLLAAADCALITLDDRALGVMSPSKLHASLAMGLPILYYGPPGSNVDEAIARFSCGRSLRQGQVDEGVAFLRRLLRDEGTVREMRRAARAAFELAHCDEAALPRFDALLDELAPGGSA